MPKELDIENGEVQDATHADFCPGCEGHVKDVYEFCPWCGEHL